MDPTGKLEWVQSATQVGLKEHRDKNIYRLIGADGRERFFRLKHLRRGDMKLEQFLLTAPAHKCILEISQLRLQADGVYQVKPGARLQKRSAKTVSPIDASDRLQWIPQQFSDYEYHKDRKIYTDTTGISYRFFKLVTPRPRDVMLEVVPELNQPFLILQESQLKRQLGGGFLVSPRKLAKLPKPSKFLHRPPGAPPKPKDVRRYSTPHGHPAQLSKEEKKSIVSSIQKGKERAAAAKRPPPSARAATRPALSARATTRPALSIPAEESLEALVARSLAALDAMKLVDIPGVGEGAPRVRAPVPAASSSRPVARKVAFTTPPRTKPSQSNLLRAEEKDLDAFIRRSERRRMGIPEKGDIMNRPRPVVRRSGYLPGRHGFHHTFSDHPDFGIPLEDR